MIYTPSRFRVDLNINNNLRTSPAAILLMIFSLSLRIGFGSDPEGTAVSLITIESRSSTLLSKMLLNSEYIARNPKIVPSWKLEPRRALLLDIQDGNGGDQPSAKLRVPHITC